MGIQVTLDDEAEDTVVIASLKNSIEFLESQDNNFVPVDTSKELVKAMKFILEEWYSEY